jgi:hypothetical protein
MEHGTEPRRRPALQLCAYTIDIEGIPEECSPITIVGDWGPGEPDAVQVTIPPSSTRLLAIVSAQLDIRQRRDAGIGRGGARRRHQRLLL